MSNDMHDGSGPLGHFRVGRRAMLQSLAGFGAVALGSSAASAAAHSHAHHATAPAAAAATESGATSQLLFLDQHAFDTLAVLSDQFVPGARAAQVPEFLDRLLSVESTETQKRFMQALGAFEGYAREAQGKPWKSLTTEQANAVLTQKAALKDGDAGRGPFDGIKRAVAEMYYNTEPGMKEMGYNGNFAFAPPTCS